jgi:transcriptional regulator with XRE-family HTH domain
MTQQEQNRQASGVDHPLSPEVVIRKIRFLIDAHHETVPGLARGIGVLPNTIQDVLDGQAFPSRALVRRIAERFSLPVEFFSAEIGSTSESKGTGSGPRAARKSPQKSARSRRPKGAPSTPAAAKVPATAKPVARAQDKVAAAGAVVPGTAVLQQALIELLIQKGLISADEWNARVRLVSKRNAT